LTGKAARYDINNASPRFSIKGANVIPNRERREKAVVLSGAQYACGIRFPFDGADSSPSKQLASKDSATGSGEQCEFTKSIIALLINHVISCSVVVAMLLV
jgi:hypothetical protein